MANSMTAFSRMTHAGEGFTIVWEVRSVNHRYLDIHLRLPDSLRQLEPQCRGLISERLARGRVDALLRVEQQTLTADFDHNLAQRVITALEHIGELGPRLRPASTMDILKWPGVMQEQAAGGEAMMAAAMATLTQAVAELGDNRGQEGARLVAVMEEKIARCEEIAISLRARYPEIQQHIRSRWESRIDDLAARVEPERLAPEIALLLTKSDITEELDRLATHLEQARSLLGAAKPIGRNLEFLLQELHREANTMGAKSVHAELTEASVQLKILLDQLREQVQNIE